MGLFWRKKKKKESVAVEEQKIAAPEAKADGMPSDEEIAVISAAMMAAAEQPSNDELLAVISAAIAAAESAQQPGYGPDSPEVVAVISAAIAAYESDRSGNFYSPYGYSNVPTRRSFRKINRTAGMTPAWGVAGNREAIDARRF